MATCMITGLQRDINFVSNFNFKIAIILFIISYNLSTFHSLFHCWYLSPDSSKVNVSFDFVVSVSVNTCDVLVPCSN
jgi:hypothetical protein